MRPSIPIPTSWLNARKIVPLFLALLTATLSGCQTASLKTAQDHTPSNGIIAFKYTANGARTILLQNPWQQVTIEDENGRTQRITVVTDGLSRSALYIGSVPPGRYRFTEFAGQLGNTVGTPSDEFAKFQVAPGRVTYLGTIVEHGNEAQFVLAGGKTKSFLLYDPEPAPEGLSDVINLLYPGLTGVSLAPKSFIAWAEPDDGQKALYGLVRRASRGLIDPVELPGGEILFGTLLGQLRIWHPDKGWRQIDIGLNRAVEAFAVTKSGDWLVGGEMGLLRRSADQGKNWRDVRTNIPYGVIKDIHVMDDGTLYLSHYRNRTFTLYRGNAALKDWSSVQSAPFAAPGQLYGYTPQRLNTHRHGATLYTTLPNAQLAVFDTASAKSVVRPLPGAFATVRISRDGVLRGTFEKFIVWGASKSRDDGRTWESAAIGKNAFMPAFRNKSSGLAIELQAGLTRGSAYLTETTDGGATWNRLQEFPTANLRWIEFAGPSGIIYVTNGVGNLYYSRDDGKTWTHDPVRFDTDS